MQGDELPDDRPSRRPPGPIDDDPVLGVHVGAIVGVVATGWSWRGLALAFAAYFVRMFVVTAAYHRYFSPPRLQDLEGVPARAGAGRARAPPRRFCGGRRPSPPASQTLGHRRRRPLTRQRGLQYSHLGWILTREWTGTGLTVVSIWPSIPSSGRRSTTASSVCCPPWARAGVLLDRGYASSKFLVSGLIPAKVDAANLARHATGRRQPGDGDGFEQRHPRLGWRSWQRPPPPPEVRRTRSSRTAGRTSAPPACSSAACGQRLDPPTRKHRRSARGAMLLVLDRHRIPQGSRQVDIDAQGQLWTPPRCLAYRTRQDHVLR